MKLLTVAVIFAATTLNAATVLLDRPLPDANLNNAAGSNRSNVAWADSPAASATFNWTYGDDFTIGAAGQTFNITGLTVWVVGDAAHDPLNNIFSSLSLLGGTIGSSTSASGACPNMTGSGQSFSCLNADGISGISTVNTNGTDSNVSISPVTYTGGDSYQSTSGAAKDIYQVTFENLNWAIDGGTTYAFFVTGDPGSVGNGDVSPFLSASNAALSGNTQDGADNLVWELAQDATTDDFVAMSQWNSLNNGWDKSTDINVAIEGTETPEPATLGLFAVGLSALGLIRRRKA
ncbi:MAG TPA: PEP-CTERM sorting domain-containing protein [Bryobacteraceae bacterium]|nr:PEP-CTERM sorting domain-containing protein [Bryobacteraceae bacterium]